MRIEKLKGECDAKKGECDANTIKKLLRKWLAEEQFDILVKCWTFPKYEEFWKHCGQHTELIKQTIQCRQWTHVTQGLRDQLEAIWKHKDKILVACADGQGTHRSVSVAAALTQLCLKKGLLSRGPHHLCSENWKKKEICFECNHCKPNKEKEDMYDQLQHETAW